MEDQVGREKILDAPQSTAALAPKLIQPEDEHAEGMHDNLSCKGHTLAGARLHVHADERHLAHPQVDALGKLVSIFVVSVNNEDGIALVLHQLVLPWNRMNKMPVLLKLLKDAWRQPR